MPMKLQYRSAPLAARIDGPATLDEKTRSVEVVLATQTPTRVYDYDRGVIDEVLLVSGAEIPANRQLVLLDAHSRYETSDVIGSVRDIRPEGDRLVGRAYYSTAPEAESPWIKAREGHLTDYSVGYRVDESVWVPVGQTSTIAGQTYAGPVQVVTRWTPRELSAVPVGADAQAKARAEAAPPETPNPNQSRMEEHSMDPKLRHFLERSGLPQGATEPEAWAFLETLGARQEPQPAPSEHPAPPDLDAIRAAAVGAERERIREIDALLTRYDYQHLARALIVGEPGKAPPTLAEASRAVMEELHKRSRHEEPVGFSGIRMGADSRDKFRAAAEGALLLRAGLPVSSPAPGAEDLRGYKLPELARECLRAAGQNHYGDVRDIAGRAMTSSDFPYILSNLITKSMESAWEEADETWGQWCGTGTVADFKTYYDMALSEFDDLEEIAESGEIKYGSFDEKIPEQYRARSYGKKYKVTRPMIIDDDMNALTDLPARRAESAKRKIGDIAYAILIANANIADGSPLFDASAHGNDAVSGYCGAPGVANLAEAIRAMGTHKDIKGLRRLNIRPVFYIAPRALEGVSEVFFKSEKYSDSNTVATDSSLASTRANPYSGAYFQRIYESRLDDDDPAQWYLAARKGKAVKVVFLNGKQTPILEMNQPGFSVEGFEYAVVIDAGAYPANYRGLYRNAGA